MPIADSIDPEMLAEMRALIGELIDGKLKAQKADVERLIKERTSRMPPGTLSAGAAVDSAGRPVPQLAAVETFRSFLASSRSHRSTVSFDVPWKPGIERKAAIAGVGGTGGHVAGIYGAPALPLRIADLMPVIPVTSGASVEWTRELSFTPSAGIVAEAALKPETPLTFENVVSQFQVIATWTKCSLQSLNDLPALQNWISQRLAYAVELKQESTFLTALLAAAAPLSAGYTPTGTPTGLDLIGSAIAQLQGSGYSPDAVCLNAQDAAKLRLLKTSTGEYLWSSPDSAIATSSTWSVPTVIAPGLAPGTALVGAFGQACVLFEREMLRVDISYENEDDFVRNMSTLRGELRAALAIPIPAGLVEVTVTTP